MASDTYVRARIDTDTKERAAQVLDAIGLSVSDAIRMLMIRVAEDRRLPFQAQAPQASRQASILPAARSGAGMITDHDFTALTIDTSGWKFDRDEANER